ncbi:tetratricopeptide repeat protein [Alloacidobacterium dinghuense]|uniref:Tetratricopeptide repeat protein n=1 Tax=Alloacidobacterium dinghuense TaxID=2763107 RepID=A0A7G8BNZ9_9BACT|nr:tetratricopeptide repeat protein [Alloacidobacterium dinghuense]QNI34269.1 tetratricopeptide repeat protein [Alloacidobacterium dinghuense]
MSKSFELASLIFFPIAVSLSSTAQVSSKTPAVSPTATAEHAASLAENGNCSEAVPLLVKSVAHITDKELQKRSGLAGVRCATLLQQTGPLLDFVRILNQQFPHDPEVLYISVHAYSDLSNHAAQELAQTAPNSIPSLEMDADANELQGKWDQAEKDYRKILEQNPRYPGIHFRLARLLLSKPNPPADFQDQAKKELLQELEIDPANAGAEYVLGELARQASDFPEAIQRFTKATKFDPSFADAYLGLGMSLLAEKNYAEAVAPLEMAVKFQPGNPAAHYGLATAYARTGRKEDAQREFALQQQAADRTGNQGAPNPQ